jgi:hypothetical protein
MRVSVPAEPFTFAHNRPSRTMSNKRIKKSSFNRFYELPEKIKTYIYLFDSTYHDIFRGVVASVPFTKSCMLSCSKNHDSNKVRLLVHLLNEKNISLMVSDTIYTCARHVHRVCNTVIGAMTYYIGGRLLNFNRKKSFDRAILEGIEDMDGPSVLKRPKITVLINVCDHFCGITTIRLLFGRDYFPFYHYTLSLNFPSESLFHEFSIHDVPDNIEDEESEIFHELIIF